MWGLPITFKDVYEPQQGLVEGFTRKYKINRLVYFEETNDILTAISHEKQIKGWRRSKKLELIKSVNSSWRDLSQDWE